MSFAYPVLLLVLMQLVNVLTYRPGLYKKCLSCPPVSHPHECRTFAEVWPHERCAVNLILLLNGSIAYEFGYEQATDCVHADSLVSENVRRKRIPITDISLCHKCCTENFCNRKLCGIPESTSTNLACLIGNEVTGLPFDTSLTFCDVDEQCYAGRVVHRSNPRPNEPEYANYANYGCASQVMCEQLLMYLHNVSSSTHCHGCCSEDGCNAQICQSQVQGTTPTATTSTYNDCWDLRNRGHFTENAIYDIYPPPDHSHVRVRCDMKTDGGGWTILQRRYDGHVNFTRLFQDYEEGFGDVSTEYWVGLRWIHVLTTQEPVQLRVDLSTFSGRTGYAVYDGFHISNHTDMYRQHTGMRSGGNISQYLEYSNGRVFDATERCGTMWRGGWWHWTDCYSTNLNGGRYNGGNGNGIIWGRFGGASKYQSLRSSEMKIRPLNVTIAT